MQKCLLKELVSFNTNTFTGIYLCSILHSHNMGMKKVGESFFCMGGFVKQQLFNRIVIGFHKLTLLFTIPTTIFISIVKHLVTKGVIKGGGYGKILYSNGMS